MRAPVSNPALVPQENEAARAGRIALERMYACLDEGRSFRLEAGAGAGKTYSLDKALRRLIAHHGPSFIRQHKKIACITYTNVAKDEVIARTNAHPALYADTIHGFAWSILRDFQTTLRQLLPDLPGWEDRLVEAGGMGTRKVVYELGYLSIDDERVSLRHDDVIRLLVQALKQEKFRTVLHSRYPVLLIDEYQDTNADFVNALKQHFLDSGEGPLIGLFGDHWQKIYGDGCGLVEHSALEAIDKNANFRSVDAIVQVLNRMRPELPQMVRDPNLPGEARVFHTNAWPGERRSGHGGGHWKGDTSAEAAREYIQYVRRQLTEDGWDFSVGTTKILMLSHNVLAREQGYASIPQIYGRYNEPWLKKEDPHIAFLADQIEPACAAFEARKYGSMFQHLGMTMPRIRRHQDKRDLSRSMQALVDLRLTGTIGDVIEFIEGTPVLRLPPAVRSRENAFREAGAAPAEDEPRRVSQLRKLKDVQYRELIALNEFIDGQTPFATKHGVKGAEFENVLVIIGRGWNKYNFCQMLDWLDDGPPADKRASFEDNRNLFYVACSRPKVRLALLFTQLLSPAALAKLNQLFGGESVFALPAKP